MSETDQHVNGTAPAPAAAVDDAPCEDCATSGEKILAGIVIAFALGLLAMAFDMWSGGKVSGFVRERVTE